MSARQTGGGRFEAMGATGGEALGGGSQWQLFSGSLQPISISEMRLVFRVFRETAKPS
jgi:hypothetical protein